jgi:hypothetical protein
LSDIFEEVEESIRQDKAGQLWKRFGPIVWAAGLLLIGAVAYYEWSKGQQLKATETRVEVFEAARAELAAGNYAEAQSSFKELVDANSELSPLAAQFLAKAYYEGNGDAAVAAETLQTVADFEGPIERLALLKAAYLRADAMTLVELEAYLGTLPGESTALGAMALELVAAKALKEGDIARARSEFGYLRFADKAPPGVLQRAEIALSVLPEPAQAAETPLINSEGEVAQEEADPAAQESAQEENQ